MAFGGMNLFARSLGGILSDWADARYQMQGRLWAHFLSLFGQAVFLFIFGLIDKNAGGWPVALLILIIFSIFVNMAEGTSYGIVPFMIPEELPVVSAVVGAGGTLGAVIATWCFYKTEPNTLTSFKIHAVYVLFWALTVMLMKWDHLGSMFGGPTMPKAEEAPPVDGEAARNVKFRSDEVGSDDFTGVVKQAPMASNCQKDDESRPSPSKGNQPNQPMKSVFGSLSLQPCPCLPHSYPFCSTHS
mmetsp:Transcript_9876/g.17742  ORF Transcript_9876/g.17742 Transcript_9876/m.17742 type:complete len:244 (+) Transcript_9876:1-732(+)